MKITYKGLTFAVTTERDDDYGLPWENDCGFGIVTSDPDTPGALHLGSGWYYDHAASLAKAEQDQWGLPPELAAGLTPAQITAKAVALDFQRLKDWAEGNWWHVGVIVTLLDLDGRPTHENESLWGIESDSPEYHAQEAQDLAAIIAARIGKSVQVTKGATTQQVRTRPPRPWHPDVYRRITGVLTGRNVPSRKAHAIAARFAKRKGPPEKVMVAFNREFPA